MTIQIRYGVFETNSSSTHSISVATGAAVYETLPLSQDDYVVLKGGEFGWERADYNDALTKANYMAIYAMSWAHKKPRSEGPLTEADHFYYKEEFTEILKGVIKRQTGCKDVIFAFGTDWNDRNWSYIDHQSVESNDYHHLFYDDKLLKQFLFDSNSWLETDNDNH